MEKLLYLLWKPAAHTGSDWQQRCLYDLPAGLRTAGATGSIRLGLDDASIAPATAMRQPWPAMPQLPDALVSFWLDSASRRHSAEACLGELSNRVAGYAVLESEPLPNQQYPAATGERTYGMNHVVFLQTPPRLSREEWLATWLDNHTRIAIETQQTFGYRQNVVVRALTTDAPPIDAIVEENFPPAAMTDQNAFYRQDPPEQLSEYQRAMYQSCKRFIDFDKMGRLPTSEYNFN